MPPPGTGSPFPVISPRPHRVASFEPKGEARHDAIWLVWSSDDILRAFRVTLLRSGDKCVIGDSLGLLNDGARVFVRALQKRVSGGSAQGIDLGVTMTRPRLAHGWEKGMHMRAGRATYFLLAALIASLPLLQVTPSQAATVTLVTTGANNPNEWPIFVGKRKNFFAEAGIKLEQASASSTASAIQQLAAGSGDMASGGITDPIRAIDNGAGVSLIRIHSQVPPYTVWAKPAIKTLADLRGKIVILGGAKDITRVYFDRMVRPNGLKAGDFDMVFAGTTPSRFAALQAGAVDAAILLPPFSFRAESAGFSLVGRLSDYVKDMPFTGYVVNTRWAKANRPTVVSFFKAYQKSVDWFRDPANRAEAIAILIAEAKVDPADAAATYDFFKSIDIFSPKGVVTTQALAPLVKALADDGDMQGSADPARFIDAEIVQMNVEAAQ